MLIEKLVSDLKLREYMLSVITYMRRQKRKIYTFLIEKDEDDILVVKVSDLSGCHTQVKTMSENY